MREALDVGQQRWYPNRAKLFCRSATQKQTIFARWRRYLTANRVISEDAGIAYTGITHMSRKKTEMGGGDEDRRFFYVF